MLSAFVTKHIYCVGFIFEAFLQSYLRASESLARDAAFQVAVFALMRTAGVEVAPDAPVFHSSTLRSVECLAVDDFLFCHSSFN